MGIKLSLSYFSVFIDADPPPQTLGQKLGRSGEANQTYLWTSPYHIEFASTVVFISETSTKKCHMLIIAV